MAIDRRTNGILRAAAILTVLLFLAWAAEADARKRRKEPKRKPSPEIEADSESASADPAPEPSGSAAIEAPPLSVGTFLPNWTEGLTWTVKSVYRKLPVNRKQKATPGEAVPIAWTEPTFWGYRIKMKASPGGVNYLLQVRNKDGSKANMASLFLARFRPQSDAPEVLSLFKGKFYTMIADQPRSTVKAFSKPPGLPQPVIADDSIIPYDLPAMPFLPPAPPGQPKTELTRTYKVTEEMDGLKFARDVVQIELQNRTLEEFAGKELLDYMKEKRWSTDGLVLVEIRRQFDGTRIRQVWSPKLPWAVYSESPTCRSWLWETTAAAPGASPAPGGEAATPTPGSTLAPSPAGSAAPVPPSPASPLPPPSPVPAPDQTPAPQVSPTNSSPGPTPASPAASPGD